jgi:hypothetical protein
MRLEDALEQIDAIHAHLARGEVYRGYRPLALALSGGLGLLAGAVQPWLVGADDPPGFLRYWVLVALLSGLVGGGATLLDWGRRGLDGRRTAIVMRQFLPCLAAGAAVTLALVRLPGGVALLPGVWALLYGLGTIASLPYLPRLAGAVAAWFLASGGLMLFLAAGEVPPGWTVGVPFGAGLVLAAWVLQQAWRREERP